MDMRAWPLSWKTRNLVRFCRHPAHESLDDSFAANFSFRDRQSRFSILKNNRTAPGPDEGFATFDIDSRLLFEKLLGLELDFPGMAPAPLGQVYNSMNYYRSHIEEVFYLNGARPLPPVEGTCLMFFADTDRLIVEYRLRNPSAASVPVRLRWFSVPAAGARCSLTRGGFRVACRQRVALEYDVFASVATDELGIAFRRSAGRVASGWADRTIAPRRTLSIAFTVEVDYRRMPRRRPIRAAATGRALGRSVRAMETAYARLAPLPAAFRRFEPLVLKAAGTLQTLRYLDRDERGRPVATCHSGKCGLAATWFWDSGFSLLGIGLAGDAETGFGVARVLLDGIRPDGTPPLRRQAERYRYGYQQPILAWGIDHLVSLCPGRALPPSTYDSLARYVRHWLDACDHNGNGLAEYPAGGTCWDDALRWQTRFPIAYRRGEAWAARDWGEMRPDHFESVDTNTHLYLECAAMSRFAARSGRQAEARGWRRQAEGLKQRINEELFNVAEGVYQDRCIADGRFSGMVTPASFLPLYAGLTPPATARALCRRYLLNPDRFYTTFPFPTLDRSHPAYRSGGGLAAPPDKPGSLVPQAYWIGRSWPHVCYWMVGALHRSGLRAEADRAAADVLDAIGRSEAIYECYDSLTGFGNGHPECQWSCAAVLALAFQYYKQNP